MSSLLTMNPVNLYEIINLLFTVLIKNTCFNSLQTLKGNSGIFQLGPYFPFWV